MYQRHLYTFHVLTCNEKRVTRENNALITVLEEVANAVLRVTWSVQRFDRDAFTDLESLSVLGRLRHRLAVLTTDYCEFSKFFKLTIVSTMQVHVMCCTLTISSFPPA